MKKDGIHVTTATVVNVNGTNGSYHSLTSENKIGDMNERTLKLQGMQQY